MTNKYISNVYIQEKLGKINRMGQILNNLAETHDTDNLNDFDCEYEKRSIIDCFEAILKEFGEEIK